jgi:hypothetical protein
MLQPDVLTNKIYKHLNQWIEDHKVPRTVVKTRSTKDGKDIENFEEYAKDADGKVLKFLPLGQEFDLLLQGIAQSVAQEVIAHLKLHMELKGVDESIITYGATTNDSTTKGPFEVDSTGGNVS